MPVAQYPPGTIALPATIGDKATASVTFRRDDGQPLEVGLADGAALPAGLEVRFERVEVADPAAPGIPGGSKAGDVKATLSFGPVESATQQNASLALKTNHPARPTANLPLWIRVAAPLEPYPPTVSIVLQNGAVAAYGRVDLRATGAQQFEVTGLSVEGDLPGATVRSLNPGPAGVHPLEIAVRGGALAPGVHLGRLVVNTSHPKVPRLEVPVRLQVAPAPAAAAPATGGAPGAPAGF
ncbi:MAG: hypothetical protein H6Q01_847 [Acidobacteria bacterium]|nr:hypothetical protein [Acidobacteriota bacterium]